MKMDFQIDGRVAQHLLVALKWSGEPIDDIDSAVNFVISKYIEESGLPFTKDGDPIENIVRIVEFVYNKDTWEAPKWRKVFVIEETDKYFKGYENGEFKVFCKSKILGDRVMDVRVD